MFVLKLLYSNIFHTYFTHFTAVSGAIVLMPPPLPLMSAFSRHNSLSQDPHLPGPVRVHVLDEENAELGFLGMAKLMRSISSNSAHL